MSPEEHLPTLAQEPVHKPRTAEAFMVAAGERYGFLLHEVQNLFTDSKALSPDDPFHNYEHHLDSLWAGIKVIDEFTAKGISVDAKIVTVALMRHDTQDPYDLLRDSHKFPEIESAALLIRDHENEPKRYGLSDDQAIKAADLIISTAKNSVIDSDEKAIMVLADLDNVGSANEGIFISRSNLLQAELESKGILKEGDEAVFRANTVATLATYFVKLWSRDQSYEWLQHAQRNLLSYILTSASEAGLSPTGYVTGLRCPEASKFLSIVKLRGLISEKPVG